MITKDAIKARTEELFNTIEFTAEPAGLYDPLRYMIAIGGKRVRPLLCLLTYSLFKDEFGPEIVEPARALEVFHTFTLMHDDIMDRSPLRRGQATVWKKWNEDTAILSGDVMLIDAYKRIASAPKDKLDAVLNLFSTTAAQVCDGQQYDMEFETQTDVSMEDYEKMIGLKTAVLLACSAKMGAIIAGATPEQCDALYNYGYQLGMAFQVADDYLDAFGDEKVFGKPIGGDIIQQKKSWLVIRSYQKARDKRAAFDEAMAMPSDTPEQREQKIAAVKALYTELGVVEDAKAEIERFSILAMEAVEGLKLGVLRMEELRRFADRLVGRAK